MHKRINTNPIKVGNVIIGGNDHVSIQSMCNIKTSKVDEVISQILEAEKYGLEIIRVSVLDETDAFAILKIKEKIHVPIVADIHYDYKLAILAMNNGADKIRINPSNIGSIDKIKEVIKVANAKNIPIRIGINAGSLEKDILAKYGPTAKGMIKSAKRNVKLFEDNGFNNIAISLKSSSFIESYKAYLKASKIFKYPLHIGVTESGTLIPGIINSTLCLSKLLEKGIGNTIRISLNSSIVDEVKVAKHLLSTFGLVKMPRLICCPTCGRCQINSHKYVKELEEYLYGIDKDITVALMGCSVNGPGEAREADVGVAGANKSAILFKKGKIIKTIPEQKIVSTLIDEVNKL